MFFSSLTTFSVSHKLVQKYLPFWVVCHQPLVTNQPSQQKWVNCKNVSLQLKKGSVTSIQAIYVPADDYTDPAPATAFAHLDSTTNLERKLVQLGIYPAVDPLASSSRALAPEIVGEEHYAVAAEVKTCPSTLP